MMIRALRSLGRGLPRLSEGDTSEVEDDIGRMLVERGLAMELPSRTVQAVPAENATVKTAVEDVKAYRRKARNEADE